MLTLLSSLGVDGKPDAMTMQGVAELPTWIPAGWRLKNYVWMLFTIPMCLNRYPQNLIKSVRSYIEILFPVLPWYSTNSAKAGRIVQL